ncbi:DNA-processing protein DprA [Candidatus Saccharibacteria bacterium]|nr:DNA-processing protein DprA [Candidatus Saccharibacteria bacterium]
MSTQKMSKDAQAILIMCCGLGVGGGVVPLKPAEWRRVAQILVARGMRPGDLLDLDAEGVKAGLGYGDAMAERMVRLMGRSASLFFEIAELEKIGIRLVTRADEEYSPQLRRKLGDNCPPYFFYAGDLRLLKERCVGFVGSRNLMVEDIDFEGLLVERAVKAGYVIVSGGAQGADRIAEEVGLKCGGRVVEFLPGKMLEKMRSSQVVRAIQDGKMLLLSYLAPSAGFSVGGAMGRNKFIYAQSEETVVVKSEGKGGTWAGAVECLENGYAVVRCWNNEKYPENLELIRMGARPIDENWVVGAGDDGMIPGDDVAAGERVELKQMMLL